MQPAGGGAHVSAGGSHPEFLLIRTGESFRFVPAAGVRWIEAEGHHVRLHLDRERVIVRQSITELERLLDPAWFARIHRSFIVNVEAVREMRALAAGGYQVVMTDGTELRMTRTYARRVVRQFSGE